MKRDLDLLQGTWSVSELIVEGQALPASFHEEARVIVKGTRFVSKGMGADYEGTVEIDESKNPRHLTMKFDVGPEKGNTNLCIYELDGNTWRMCIATRGNIRPKDFVSPAGSGFAVETLQRGAKPAKAKKNADKPASISTPTKTHPVTEFEGEWQMLSGVFDGNPMPASDTKWVRRTTTGNQTIVKAGPQTMLQCEFKLDTSQTPRNVTYLLTAGPSKGKTQTGIYTLDNDVLTVCMSAPNGVAPTRFESVRGSGTTLTSWKRI